MEELNDWRALTVTLMMRVSDSETKNAAKKSLPLDELEKLILALTPLAKRYSNLEQLEKGLQAIFVEAIVLSETLYKQRADWRVKFPNSSPRFHTGKISEGADTKIDDKLRVEFLSDSMEDVNDDSGNDMPTSEAMEKEVCMFVFPGLFKCGDSN